jgi:peptidoglycan/xylan/chitin deacetylase (PgdA/CDA1 family)
VNQFILSAGDVSEEKLAQIEQPARALPEYGAFVISLDFELHWGVRDHATVDGPYRANLLGARVAVEEMLRLFADYGVHGTWAVVGFLFARNRDELRASWPAERPTYLDRSLDPYVEPVGEGESDDPLHYAPSLIQLIQDSDGQELATHTYSHYYCKAPGQLASAFAADLSSARAIAGRSGVALRSIVFPRNQHNPSYDEVLCRADIRTYRGYAKTWMYRENGSLQGFARAARLIDAYVPLNDGSVGWDEIVQPNGLNDVAASMFLRPVRKRASLLSRMRLRRIQRLITRAAQRRRIAHLWWHPHNFGVQTEENVAFLREILETYRKCAKLYGMKSLTMSEVGDCVTSNSGSSEEFDTISRPRSF